MSQINIQDEDQKVVEELKDNGIIDSQGNLLIEGAIHLEDYNLSIRAEGLLNRIQGEQVRFLNAGHRGQPEDRPITYLAPIQEDEW